MSVIDILVDEPEVVKKFISEAEDELNKIDSSYSLDEAFSNYLKMIKESSDDSSIIADLRCAKVLLEYEFKSNLIQRAAIQNALSDKHIIQLGVTKDNVWKLIDGETFLKARKTMDSWPNVIQYLDKDQAYLVNVSDTDAKEDLNKLKATLTDIFSAAIINNARKLRV